MRMFVGNAPGSSDTPRIPASSRASLASRAWSSGSRPRSSSSATSAAAARTPACRIPPPKSFLTRRASATNAFEPATALPTGARRPFEKQTITESRPLRERGLRHPEGRGRVPEPRAVEVDRQAPLPGEDEDLLDGRPGQDGAAGEVVGVLEADDRGAREVVDRLRPDPRLDSGNRHPAAGPGDRAREESGERGHRPHLVVEDVAPLLDDDLGPGAPVDPQRDLVPHRAGRDEEGRLEAEDLGRPLLEASDRRVLAVDVVADLGLGHGAAHRRRRLRDGVGTEVGTGGRARAHRAGV